MWCAWRSPDSESWKLPSRTSSGIQKVRSELRDGGTADHRQRLRHLVLENAYRTVGTRASACDRPIEHRPSREAKAGAEAMCRDDPLAAANTAVEQHGYSMAYRAHHSRQHIDGRRQAVELHRAVIGDRHRIRAGIGGHRRIVRMHDSLDDQGAGPQLADAIQIL